MVARSTDWADVTVIGSGVIALSCSVALADRGSRVRLVGTAHAGEASTASAGMLAPSVEAEMGAAHAFAIVSRDRYPAFAAALEQRTGIRVPLNDLGILELAPDDAAAERLRADLLRAEATPAALAEDTVADSVGIRAGNSTGSVAANRSIWLDRTGVAQLEPELAHAAGAVLHPRDGAVDPLALMDALREAVARHPNVVPVRENACALEVDDRRCSVVTDGENRFESDQMVLAAGAWTPLIRGAGTAVAPVEPVRGQMLSFAASPVRHVVVGAGGYIVPRVDGSTVAGSTMERVGFDHDTTTAGLGLVRRAAERICPALRGADVTRGWAGLRPVTPDLLPIIGRDPERSRLVHASGHSRNGILLAPLTADVIADIVLHAPVRYDLHQFRPGRF